MRKLLLAVAGALLLAAPAVSAKPPPAPSTPIGIQIPGLGNPDYPEYMYDTYWSCWPSRVGTVVPIQPEYWYLCRSTGTWWVVHLHGVG